MIVDARDHHDQLLARIYTWMTGPSEAGSRSRELDRLGIAHIAVGPVDGWMTVTGTCG